MRYLVIVFISIVIISSLAACGGSKETPGPTPTVNPQDTSGKVVFTIGNLTDKTGPAAQAMQYIDLALFDAIEYYNENNLIPGVELRMLEYDTQYSTSRLIPGYKWLKEQDIDMLISFLPIAPAVLHPFVNQDKIMFITSNAEREVLFPPGYTFAWACLWEELAYTQLKWVAENHWVYQNKGPAKIGGAGWNDGASNLILEAAEAYTRVHPDQFTWVDKYLTDFTFTWQAEVEGLKECDYIFIPSIMHVFSSEYVNAGHSKATFLASEPQTAFLGMITDAGRWDEIDGTLFAMNGRWWDQEPDEFLTLANEMMYEAHPDERKVRELKQAGRSYITVGLFAMICDIIKSAAEAVGTENLDSQAVYEASHDFSFYVDGLEWANFTRIKRNGYNYIIMSEADADQQTLVTASDWLPIEKSP